MSPHGFVSRDIARGARGADGADTKRSSPTMYRAVEISSGIIHEHNANYYRHPGTNLEKALAAAGPAVIVYTLPLPTMGRLHDGDRDFFDLFTETFGPSASDHSVLVFNQADRLTHMGQTQEQWLASFRATDEGKRLLGFFGSRCFFVESWNSSRDSDSRQRDGLLHAISTLPGRYCVSTLQEWGRRRPYRVQR